MALFPCNIGSSGGTLTKVLSRQAQQLSGTISKSVTVGEEFYVIGFAAGALSDWGIHSSSTAIVTRDIIQKTGSTALEKVTVTQSGTLKYIASTNAGCVGITYVQ